MLFIILICDLDLDLDFIIYICFYASKMIVFQNVISHIRSHRMAVIRNKYSCIYK